MSTQVVNGCWNCPMRDWHEGECQHPEAPPYEYSDLNKTPDWCPLRKEPLVLEFDEKLKPVVMAEAIRNIEFVLYEQHPSLQNYDPNRTDITAP